MTTRMEVTFLSRHLKIAGHLYTPGGSSLGRKGAAVVVSHPATGVKEQTAGLYARQLADAGFVALAFDAAYQGESEGLPRGLEDPYQRVEDIKSAITYLSTLGIVDRERLGVLGICASGGYVPFAAQTDQRIKAVATVSAVCIGDFTRNGLKGGPAIAQVTRDQLIGRLQQSGNDRNTEASGTQVELLTLLPNKFEDIPVEFSSKSMQREAFGYYMSSDTGHPRSRPKEVSWGVDLRANYDSFAFNGMISPRPLLMIVGSDADTAYQSRAAIDRAEEPKELYIIEGQTHIGLYSDTTETIPKLVDFMANTLCKKD